MTKQVVRTRFSPSPTGKIHLGNARAALFSALFAALEKGIFILRIEDTDLSRSEEQYIEMLQNDLHWLGINWQEGPHVGGVHGPYWQSQRQHIYTKFYHELEEKGLIYPCFCSDQTLLLARKIQLSRGMAPRYDGSCRQLSTEEIKKRLDNHEKPAWRFQVSAHQDIHFIDLVKGEQHFHSNDIGDFIIRRQDGTAPFLFSNAIDDAMMKVTHVLRGDDHLTNTPRQLLILQTLGLTPPQYGHLSLIVGDDGSPLSKRHGSFSLYDLRAQGYLPIAIINYLARLGHSSDLPDLLTFDELAKHFNINKLSRSSAHFDPYQLNYWQKIAIQALSEDELLAWLGETVLNEVPLKKRLSFAKTIQPNIVFPKEALEWAHIFFEHDIQFNKETAPIIKEAGEQFFVEAEMAIDKYQLDFKSIMKEMKDTLRLSGKKLYMPLRIALTGKMYGPELMQIGELMGKDKIKHRLGTAFKLANHF